MKTCDFCEKESEHTTEAIHGEANACDEHRVHLHPAEGKSIVKIDKSATAETDDKYDGPDTGGGCAGDRCAGCAECEPEDPDVEPADEDRVVEE